MKKQTLIPMAILATLAIPGTAAAHNATATPTCGGLAWSAVNYDKTVTNTIVVKVDGATVHQDLDFKASDTGTAPWSQTAAHTWSVVVNAPGTQYDKSFSGTWQACQTAPTTTSTQPATTTTVNQTTTTVNQVTTTQPATTTTTVAVDEPCDTTGTVATCFPPVPPTTVADLGVVTPAPTLTPVEPVLPVTGNADTVLIGACILFAAGVVLLVVRGRRVQ